MRAPGVAGAQGERIGLLGGSFNPPHLGHAALARCALKQLGLDRVLLMPVCLPPHRAMEVEPGPEHRLRMCGLLAEEADSGGRVQASSLELDRGGRSYTVETLERLRAQNPGAQITLIIGDDMAMSFGDWRSPQRILRLARLAVAPREHSEAQVRAAIAAVDSAAEPVFLDMETLSISSTKARQSLLAGAPTDALLGSAVSRYLVEHRPYGAIADDVAAGVA